MYDIDIDPSHDRLAAIKAEGRRRRERRQRRNATLGGVAVVLMVGTPFALRLADEPSDGEVFAAREGCVASTDPRCGPFHWEPAPEPNDPLTAGFAEGTTSFESAVGFPLEVEVIWDDPDASEVDVVAACWGDEVCTPPAPACVNREATGAWEPPEPSPGSGTVRLEHTYAEPGTYEISVVLRSASWDRSGCPPGPGDPYASEATVSATVHVR